MIWTRGVPVAGIAGYGRCLIGQFILENRKRMALSGLYHELPSVALADDIGNRAPKMTVS
jgi:hypothetical protein